MKNLIDSIGNRTRNLSARSAVPKPTAPPHSSVIGVVKSVTKDGWESRMHEVNEIHTFTELYEDYECKNPLWYLVETCVIMLKRNALKK
jgi:hypothetical protein